MSTWQIGSLRVVSGGKSNDDATQEAIQEHTEHYSYGPPPGQWTVDPDNDWTIHQWALQLARISRKEVVTDYKPRDADMPDDVRSYMNQCAKTKSDSDVVY